MEHSFCFYHSRIYVLCQEMRLSFRQKVGHRQQKVANEFAVIRDNLSNSLLDKRLFVSTRQTILSRAAISEAIHIHLRTNKQRF